MGILEAKIAAGKKAAELIEPEMIVGLGTGSTATCFIESLIEKVQKGLKIQAVASSKASETLAIRGGIHVVDINAVSRIDITVDGADEIDREKRMIKGGGGAHVREKILASSSHSFIIIVDETKVVKQIGSQKLPLEIIPYGSLMTERKIKNLGYLGKWRLNKEGSLYITENGNLLFDLYFDMPLENPEEIQKQLLDIPGIVDTGFFFHIAKKVIVGNLDGTTHSY